VENHHPKPTHNPFITPPIKPFKKPPQNPHITPPLKPRHVTTKNPNYDR